MSNRTYNLRDVLLIRNGRDHKQLANGTIPVYGSGGVMRYVNEAICTSPSILLPRKGSLGNIQFASEPFWTVDTLFYTEIDKSRAIPYYLYYYLRQLDVSRLWTGTGVPSMTSEAYYNIKIVIPDLSTQLRIAGVLGSLDEKIELNRRKIRELEALAKTIYDYWFVQFDFPDKNGRPYKSSGGKMVWNDQLKREIPEGWGWGNLYAIANFENGLACQRFRPMNGEPSLPVIKIREMHEGINADTEKVAAKIPEKHRISDGDLLFSWSASLEAMIWCGDDGGLNQHIFKVMPRGEYSTEYVYRQLSSYIVNFKKMAEARKTTMGHITTDHIKQSRVVLPTDAVLSNFASIINPISKKRIELKKEVRMVMELRDHLLPLLMNGQVCVGNAK